MATLHGPCMVLKAQNFRKRSEYSKSELNGFRQDQPPALEVSHPASVRVKNNGRNRSPSRDHKMSSTIRIPKFFNQIKYFSRLNMRPLRANQASEEPCLNWLGFNLSSLKNFLRH